MRVYIPYTGLGVAQPEILTRENFVGCDESVVNHQASIFLQETRNGNIREFLQGRTFKTMSILSTIVKRFGTTA